jgi:hypothetical protein
MDTRARSGVGLRAGLIALAAIATQACERQITGPEPQRSEALPVTEARAHCPGPDERMRVLVDASHGGGVWWFPQSGPFDPEQPHQGRDLAQRLREFGFEVDEAPRNGQVPVSSLSSYGAVIRVGNFGAYTKPELEAYQRYASCSATLVVLGEYLDEGDTDPVAEMLGVVFAGTIRGQVSEFATHPLTERATAFQYIAGSYIASATSDVELLGWVDGLPVMAALESRRSKRLFLGDVNGLQRVPQPFTDNLIAWMMSE